MLVDIIVAGVDIIILGVGIGVLVSDVLDLGVDVGVLVSYVVDLGVDVGVLVSHVLDLGVDIGDLVADVLVLGADIIVLVSARKSAVLIGRWREDALERVSAAVCLEAPRATGGVERCIIDAFWEVDQGRAWVFEEPYDVASEDIGGLLDFLKPPGTIKGMVPNGGSDRQRSG